VREAAIRQGTTDARSTGPRGRAGPAKRLRPSGEGGGRPIGNKKNRPRLGRKSG
jgi:hypothetical protein